MMEMLKSSVETINNLIWGWPMIVLLLGTHIYLTVRTGGIQKWVISKGIKLSVTPDPEGEGEVSPFGALTTALAATIGTGNIVGVGTAIYLGGPGAVLWCWLSGLLGMATKYAESYIAVKYRVKTEDGRMQGGAMYALERGLNMKWLATVFAVLGVLASFGIGCAVQVNSIAEICEANFGISPKFIGVIVAMFTTIVIFGGIKVIANICEKLVPFMAIFYVMGCFSILILNIEYIIPAIATICKLAFTPGAVTGGLVGTGIMMAIRFGVARGLFSNESGLGSAAIASAAAQARNPVRQALVSATGTFWDTGVVCLMTGLVLVSTLLKYPDISLDTLSNGGQLTSIAFSQIPVIGPLVLTLGIISFAYSTVLGWAYYGERCVEYFAGRKALLTYRLIYIVVAVVAPIVALDLVWVIADTFNALMAIPNIIAVLLLSNQMVEDTKKYINNLDAKDETSVPVVES